jgi:hypothetical protein
VGSGNDNGYDNCNGNGKSWKTWALGIFSGITISGFAWAWNVNYTEIDRLRTQSATRGERIAIVEAEVKRFREDIVEMKAALSRMEGKLDHLLQERRPR